MTERLLELAIYGLSVLIVGLVIWVILRELLKNLKESEEEFKSHLIKTLMRGWLHASTAERKGLTERIKRCGSAEFAEAFFFEFFDMSTKEEKKELQVLYEVVGIQWGLRRDLKESPDIVKREEAVLKMGRIGVLEDIPFLLDVFKDPEEHRRVKQCCVEAISDLSETLLMRDSAVANFGLLVRLLEVPNVQLRERLADILAKLPMKTEDMIPHLLMLQSDTSKEGMLALFSLWSRKELAPLLYDLLDDESASVRKKTIELLGRWKDEASILLLIRALNDPDSTVRLAVVDAVSQWKKASIKKELFKHHNDPDIHVQVKIFWVLAIQDYADAFPVIIEKIKDVEFRKKFFVQLSHEKRHYLDSFFSFLGLDHRIFFKRFGWGDFQHCLDAFMATAKESSSPYLRKRAMEALHLWGGEEATAVIEGLSVSDPEPKNQTFALTLLSKGLQKKGAK